jgi:MATE family multidrug resistance protein
MPLPHRWRPGKEDVRTLLRLALPVVVVQVGMMLMGTVDTLMVGRLSPEALAAVALGNLYSMAGLFFAIGVLLAVDPVVAQAWGAGDPAGVARGVQRTLVLAALLALPVGAMHLLAGPVLAFLRQPAEVVPLAQRYCVWLIPGVLPFLVFTTFRQSLQAFGRLSPVVLTIVLANLLNVGLNWTFIFGNLGAPRLEVAGSALATTGSRWFMALALLASGWTALRGALRPWRAEALSRAALGRMFRVGLPIGLQFELELGAFGAVAILAGVLGTLQVAGHQIALNVAALTYMVPLGVSAAAAVTVGHAAGRANADAARRQAVAALLVGVSFMAAMALVFLGLPGLIARLYTDDPALRALAAGLLPLAGLFQVFDGAQVVSIGVLRGVADTRTPFLVNAIGFWMIGIPVSIWLGFGLGMGVAGLWWGLVAGLAVVALILVRRVVRVLGGPVARLDL